MVVHSRATGALVVTRRRGEAILLETSDGPIEIRIVAIHSGRARVRVQAPLAVRIDREELRASRANLASAAAGGTP